ncbi:YjgN family protein [Parvibium lacunae]|uniref:DUF898 domain-containing protein n=1 Tax=Parvibium lacunae TaxID=1888893 RepID=A0A368L1P4_9BURK|nr:YjgN family protein [Parvibium lacunae]RCS57361.1 DUF898 domain-containing protein [Parvibium lacunae]
MTTADDQAAQAERAFAPTQPFNREEGPVAPPPHAAAGTNAAVTAPLPLTFTGSGSEYFRIWIINLMLSIVTLGVYSAWAKVRRLQYLYRNTQLNGSPFDYHGDPMAILKGRAIVVGLVILNNVLGGLHPLLAAFAGIALGLALPWLMIRSLHFRLRNTSYRSLRFGFYGTYKEAIRLFWTWPILLVITLFTTLPLWLQRLKTFQTNHSQYGDTGFKFTASPKAYYGLFARVAGLALLPLVLLSLAATIIGWGAQTQGETLAVGLGIGLFVAAGISYLIALLVARPFYLAKMQNLVWNHTKLGQHQFSSRAKVWPLVKIVVTNTLLTLITIGLYYPFAQIRLLQYRLSVLSLQPKGSLETFIAEQQSEHGALGEEAAEWFDFDLSL